MGRSTRPACDEHGRVVVERANTGCTRLSYQFRTTRQVSVLTHEVLQFDRRPWVLENGRRRTALILKHSGLTRLWLCVSSGAWPPGIGGDPGC